jgi:regulatory protein YycI of two-component signal transduction system YycFG
MFIIVHIFGSLIYFTTKLSNSQKEIGFNQLEYKIKVGKLNIYILFIGQVLLSLQWVLLIIHLKIRMK